MLAGCGAALVFCAGVAAQSTSHRRTPSPAPAKAPAEAPAPLREGEKLDYTAQFSKLNNVATIRLTVNGRTEFSGRSAWHLQAFARTLNPLRMIFALDDQFDSYSDAATLAGLQYEMHLNERGQKQDAVLRMTTGKEPAPANASAVRVLPGTRDPLGMVQFLRTVDWTKTKEIRGPVFDGRKLYEARARLVDSAASVSVPAGTFAATRIEVRVFERDAELKDTRFALTLANTPARTPVLLEAAMPFGNARVELTRVE